MDQVGSSSKDEGFADVIVAVIVIVVIYGSKGDTGNGATEKGLFGQGNTSHGRIMVIVHITTVILL